MNWFFLRPPVPSETCDRMQPLLSLLADGMASRAESRFARKHLEACLDCRQAYAWMQATHDVLATRETVVAPAELRARCRRAWAAEDALAPLPRRNAPSRSRVLRPAFAAALSLAVAGVVVGYYLVPPPSASVQTTKLPVHTIQLPVSVATHPAATGTRSIPVYTPSMVAAKPLREHNSVPAPKHVKDTHLTDETANLPRPSSKAIVPYTKTDAPAQVADKSTPPIAKRYAPISKQYVPKQLIAVQPKTHHELTPAVPHADRSSQIATNKVPETQTLAPPMQVVAPPDTSAPRTAEYVSAPSHSDPLNVVRVHLASLNEVGERKIAMANGVHLQTAFVQSAIVYTPR